MSSFSWKRLLSGSLVVILWQFVILFWFLIGQGYDRSTASLVAWGSWALVPLLALLLTTGVEDIGSRWARYRSGLLRSLALAVLGIWIPAVLVVGLMPLKSPFAELWWMLVGATLVSGSLTLVWQRLRSMPERVLFALLTAGAIFGWRQLLFSFF